MPKANRNKGKKWTRGDDYELARLNRLNTPTRVIGLKIGRTERAIRARLRRNRRAEDAKTGATRN
jgi:IS30 family transposase